MADLVERRSSDLEQSDSFDLDWSNVSALLLARNDFATKLADSYERCLAKPTPSSSELVLISGPSGVGKTTLALTLKKQVAEDNGFMISGKFDQLENNVQAVTTQVYSAFTEAFTQYVNMVMNIGGEAVQSIRHALENGMDPAELQVLHEMIPALESILDLRKTQSFTDRSSILKGADAEDRLIEILGFFVRTICSLGKPIVLFLDDLQWANRSALNLLNSLVATNDEVSVSCFMLLCTCRMNEVSDDDPLTEMLRDVRCQGITTTEIQVSNMTLDEVNQFVSRVLRFHIHDVLPLSDALFQITDGNLLFLIELVKKLRDEKLIIHEEGRWTWDLDKLKGALGTVSITRLIEEKFYRLDSNAQELLRIASCLGSTFSVTALSYTGIGGADEINDVLKTLESLRFIELDSNCRRYRFVHDKVQQTIYHLTSESNIEQLHLNIGRKLKQLMPKELLDENVLLVSHQISLGTHLIYDPIEKQEAAELFFLAGQKAALSASFVTASAFLRLAISLLSRRHWREQYKLSLQMYNFAAELEYYNGNLQLVDELVGAVINHAKSLDDSLVARFTRIYSLGTRESMQQGLIESLDALTLLGENFPRKPSIVHIIVGAIRCNYRLRGKSDEYILTLPPMKDKRRLAAMRLTLFSIVFAFYVSGEHVPLIAFRLVENTLRHGMSDMACVAFGCLGMILAFQGDVEGACRHGHLALRVLDTYDAREWQARVGTLVHAMVFPLKYPLLDCTKPLYAAHRSSLVFGDIHFSMFCNANFCTISYFAGTPLPRVVKETRRGRTLCIKYGQRSVKSSMDIDLQLFLNLMGQSNDPLVLTGEACVEEESMCLSKGENPLNFFYIHFVKLQLAVYMNDFAATQVMLDKLRKLDEKKMLPYMVALLHFFKGLACAMSTSRLDRKKARKHLAKLKVFAKHAPCNYMSKVYLIEAKLAAQAGNFDDAMTNFTRAIEFARQVGMINDQALACEHAAYAAQQRMHSQQAQQYMANARSLYLEWGAHAKVDRLPDFY